MREEWDGFWSKKNPQVGRASWSKRRMLNILDRYMRPGLRVLDAGCGSGFFSQYFVHRGGETYCLDYSSEALNLTRKVTAGKAKEYLRVNLLENDFVNKYKKEFDIIFTDGLLEHFSSQDQEAIFVSFMKMKKEDGIIITFVPNRYTLWRILQPIYMPGIKEEPISLSKLLRLYRNNSCEVGECGGLNVLPFRLSPEPLGRWFGMLVYCVGG